MTDDFYGAIVAKRRLSRRLAVLQARTGLSVNEASDKLGWSRGRLNRFEANQWRQPFVIDDHGGPLEIYRKQTAAMLKQLQDPTFQQTLPQASSPPVQGEHQPR